MSVWYLGTYGFFAAMLVWALWNFKLEWDEVVYQWKLVTSGTDLWWNIKYEGMRDIWCWGLTAGVVIFGATGIGVGVAMILAIILIFRLASKIQIPQIGDLVKAAFKFLADIMITTGGAGIVSIDILGPMTGGGAIGAALTVLATNVVSIMFLIPKVRHKIPNKAWSRA